MGFFSFNESALFSYSLLSSLEMKFSRDFHVNFLRIFLEARNSNLLTEKNILSSLETEDKQEAFVGALEYKDKRIGLGGIKKHLKKVISVLEKNFIETNEQIYQLYIEVIF